MKVIMPVWMIDESFVHLTKNAIESLGDVDLVIVDNGSTNGVGYVKNVAHAYIRNDENLGYAKAVNQGLERVKDEFVGIANNDIRLSPNWIEVVDEILEDSDDIGSIHLRMIEYEEPFDLGKDTWVGGKERWCSASFFVTRNFQRYDENYRNGGEDWDYWHRLRKEGYKQVYTNKAQYQHLDSYSRKRSPSQTEDDKYNEELYKEKWGMYPEEHLAYNYPSQFVIPWRPFP